MKTLLLAFSLVGLLSAGLGDASDPRGGHDNGDIGGDTSDPAGDSELIYTGTSYRSIDDSPFDVSCAATEFLIEDFEDGVLNLPGVIVSGGYTIMPAHNVDSIDTDAGPSDGLGLGGYSFFVPKYEHGITIAFNPLLLGQYPTSAGVVWTDGYPDTNLSFEAFDPAGKSLGKMNVLVGDETFKATTPEDRFFGITNDAGIAAISITVPAGAIEIDHLQIGMPASCPADINGDGVVNATDLFLFTNELGGSNPLFDLNCDGIVDGADLDIFVPSQGPCP